MREEIAKEIIDIVQKIESVFILTKIRNYLIGISFKKIID